MGSLLIDARNEFNEGNRKVMVWVTRHLWLSGARFLFNVYIHWGTLVMRGKKKKETVFLFNKEGVPQGCPLAIAGYGLLILPLIRKLKKEFSDVEFPW